MRILHIITGLSSGGAESCLYSLISNDIQNDHTVISLGGLDFYGPKLQQLGVKVLPLGYKGNITALLSLLVLIKLIRTEKPDVVQTWLYHADLLGGLAASICRVSRIVWNIRMTNPWSKTYGRSLRLVVGICALLSRCVPHKIIVCAESAARTHSAHGYREQLLSVVTNGYQLEKFAPRECDISNSRHGYFIGVVGRWDPIKNFPLLLDALTDERIANIPGCTLLMIGDQLSSDNTELMNLIRMKGLQNRVELLGVQHAMENWYPKMCVLVNCSIDEGFPNVVAEAICSGLRSIVTDVGDSAAIVGDTGWVIPSGDTELLVDALLASHTEWLNTSLLNQHEARCRKRAESKLSIENMIKGYQNIWMSAPSSAAKEQ